MFGLGPTELIVILIIGLLVLGPERIPAVATSLGKAIRSFRRATRDLSSQLDIDEDVRRPFEDLRAALRDEPAPPTFPSSMIAPPLDPPLSVPVGGAEAAEPEASLTPSPGVASLVAAPAASDVAGDLPPGGVSPHEPPSLGSPATVETAAAASSSTEAMK